MLRSEGTGRSKGSRLKGWIEGPNALRWRLDRNYAAPLPRQSREKLRTPHGSTKPPPPPLPFQNPWRGFTRKSGQDRNRSVKGFGQGRRLKLLNWRTCYSFEPSVNGKRPQLKPPWCRSMVLLPPGADL